jgi:cbb3-type cytochrome oxidase maturation protein
MMESLYFLVPCALIFIAIAVKVLFWAINNGQYDNLDTEAHRILFDDEKTKSSAEKALQQSPEKSTEKPPEQ